MRMLAFNIVIKRKIGDLTDLLFISCIRRGHMNV